MIINFKIFEEYGEIKEKSKVFWVVDNDKDFEVRLFKIGMTIEEIERFKKGITKNLDDGKRHFYFGYDPQKGWTYDDYNYTSGSNYFVSSFYKYMDHVEVDNTDRQKHTKAVKDYEDELYFREVLKKGDIQKLNL